MIRIGSVEEPAHAPVAERSQPLLPRPRASVDNASPVHKPAA